MLTTDPVQRVRLSQALLAMAMMAAGVVAMHYLVAVGVAPRRGVWIWTLLSVAGMVLALALIRSGWSARLADPSLTVPQMLYALTSGAGAYALVGAGRGGVFLIVMVILMFGMFVATPRQMAGVSAYAVALFGAVMALMAALQPQTYPPAIELGHFLMVATMMPAVSLLAGRLSRLRERSRLQRSELQQALARIRELATRDELTGLFNRRHVETLMQQEHQRCIRSGHTFCLAAIAVDPSPPAEPADGTQRQDPDETLRQVAQEGIRFVRVSDVLARWGGDRFVLLMSDTRAALARGGLERLRERIAETTEATVSAGLAEHHAGETVGQTLQRAEAALREARQGGRNRVVCSV